MGKRDKLLLPFYATAIESFDFSQYDVVISSSSGFAHGVIVPVHTKHICYCHSPMRYAWDWKNEYLREMPKFMQILANSILRKVRMWDQLAAKRVDTYFANSKTVAQRIEKYYRRESKILFPPVEVLKFDWRKPREEFFFIISALQAFKRIDLAIEAFRKSGLPLKIAGTGSEKSNLKALAKDAPNIEFLGRVSDSEAQELFETCRAFVFPGEDDFGITPVEAMAAGSPVIAYGRGGVTETVVEGETGIFFLEPSAESLLSAIDQFEQMKFSAEACRKRADLFAKEKFEKRILELVHQ